MTPQDQVKILADAHREIGQIAVEPGADPKAGLLEAQRISDEALEDAGLKPKTMKVARLKDVSD